MPFLWFHAFDRKPGPNGEADDVDAIVRALHDGPTCETPADDGTQTNETLLEIEPSCVYAYLGTSTDVFGDNVLALTRARDSDHVSPFDTGGLVKHIQPVASFDPPSLKVAFLASYSWDASDMPALLSHYPGEQEVSRERYLRGDPPEHLGPHLIWADRTPANMWRDSGNTWHAWTWELRAATSLTVDGLLYWSCAPSLYDDILRAARRLYGDSDADWAINFAAKYRAGGSGNLANDMYADQLAA